MRTKKILSGLINFAKFREERLAIFQESTTRTVVISVFYLLFACFYSGVSKWFRHLKVVLLILLVVQYELRDVKQGLEEENSALEQQLAKLRSLRAHAYFVL